MSEAVCRWGILSTASIAKKNWQAMRLAENATLSAVASRSLDKADAFINECQSQVPFVERPQGFDSYDSLLSSDSIDAVYVPLPTALRKEWVIKAAEAGKHVLCEKPCGIDADDLQEMIDACDQNKVQFMDGVMFMHSARLQKLRETVADGTSIGQLKRITSQFSFHAPDDFLSGNIRTSSALEPAGCVGDLGWYNIRFSLCMTNYAMPKQVTGRLLSDHLRGDSPQPVPMEFSGELLYENGISAGFYCSFLTEHQQIAAVSGTKGNLLVEDFVLPFFGSPAEFKVSNAEFETDICQFNMLKRMRTETANEYSNSHANSQEVNMIRNFSANVLTGTPDKTWSEIALKTQRIMDACLESASQNSEPITLS